MHTYVCTDVWIEREVYRYVYKHACTHAYGHVHRRASRHVGQAMFAGIAVGGSVGDARPCQCRRACTAFFVLVLRDGIVDRPPQLSHERTEHLQRVLAATANRHIRTDVATRRRRLSSQSAGRDGPPPQPCSSRTRRMVCGGRLDSAGHGPERRDRRRILRSPPSPANRTRRGSTATICLYICLYTYAHAQVSVHVYTHTSIHMHVHTCLRTCPHTPAGRGISNRLCSYGRAVPSAAR